MTSREMHGFLEDIAAALREFVSRVLPKNWWQDPVLKMHMARRQVTAPSGLDLAMLLRVIDQNWSEISRTSNWPPEVRCYFKEAQIICNQRAHRASEERPPADDYRDADTLRRIAQALGNQSGLIERLEAARHREIERMRPGLTTGASANRSSSPGRGVSESGAPFLLDLGKTYYHKGFFNVPVDHQRYVRRDNGPVSLTLGDSGRVVDGRSDRKANPGTGAPRIHGGAALRDWIQANFKLQDKMAVHIEAPDRIRLTKP